MAFRFRPMTQADAEAIAVWHYPEPFSFYDWSADPNDLAELLDPQLRGDAYFAVEDEADDLVGFFAFKRKPRETLDVGLGLRPFNRRAITVYERAGFAPVREFRHWTNDGEWEFVELRRPA
jgi:[ribosomal protein S18]-alanine N-acetyltransferase